MGTIAGKLSYLADTKDLFKERLNSLGAEITSSTTFRNYLTWLDTFYGEVSDKTDLSQNGVVGRTSQESTTGANIVPCLNIERTINGVTCTPQSDGTIILNGTATTQVVYPITNNSSTSIGHTISVEANSYKFMLYGDTNVSNNTYFLQVGYYASDGTTAKFYNAIDDTPLEIPTNQQIGVGLIIRQGQSFNNHIIKPMGVLSTYTGGFEPFTGNQASPNPDYPQPINNLSGDVPYKISGKNKLPFPYTEQTHTHNGVTFTLNNDGSVLVNGTATGGNATFKLYGNYREQEQLKLPSGYLSGGISNNIRLRALNNHEGNYTVLGNDLGNGAKIDTSTYNIGYIELTIINGTAVNNQLIKPMVLDSLEDTTYEPYISQTFNIPLKSKNLFDGLTTKGSYNTVTGKVDTTIYNMWRNTNPIGVNPNNDYVFSLSGTALSVSFRVFYYDINKKFISTETTTNGKFITPADCYYVNWHSTALYTNYPNGLTNAMIEESSTSTNYEPYYDIELCKIDTYEDKIYSSNGRFYLEKNCGSNIFDNDIQVNAVNNTSSNPSEISLNGTYSIIKNTLTTNIKNYTMYCTIAKYEYNSIITNNINAQTYLNDNTFCMRQGTNDKIYFKNSVFTGKTGTEIKGLIEGKKMYYVLTTPTTTEITQENYPSLYNALKQIQDYLTAYKINKEFILGYSSPEIEY